MTSERRTVRRLRAEDVAHVDAMIAGAFGRPLRPQPPPDAVPVGEVRYVVQCDDTITAFGAARSYGSVAYVGPMAVDVNRRRQGLGKILMRALIVNLEAMGARTILLDASDLGVPLYERFGFVDIDRTDVYERDGGAAALVAADVKPSELERASSIDRRLAGCDRSAALDAFSREPGAGIAVRDTGYAIAHRRVAGPWVAEDAETAAAVFAELLAARPQVEVVFVPASNLDAAQIVQAAGFTARRGLRHMALGEPSPMRGGRIYGRGSLSHG